MNKVVYSMLGILAAMLIAVDPAYAAEAGKESKSAVESEAEKESESEKPTRATSAPTEKPTEKPTTKPTEKETPEVTSKETESVILATVDDFDLAFTPGGNMTLVDDFVTSSGKQFMTVMTKAGNTFYIIVDRDADGNENVHFLNQVDERDLLSLMDESEASEVAEELESKRAEKEQEKTSEEPAETKEPVSEPTETENQVKNVLVIAIPIAVVGVIVLFLVKRKKMQGPKNDSEGEEPEDEEDYEI